MGSTWLKAVKPRLRQTSWNTYRIAVGRVKAGLGAVRLQALTPLEVEDFYAQLLSGNGGEERQLTPRPCGTPTSSAEGSR
ncbi:MAG: hypothetical protein ACRD2C_06505 [Acidimicrobiales bacterium]